MAIGRNKPGAEPELLEESTQGKPNGGQASNKNEVLKALIMSLCPPNPDKAFLQDLKTAIEKTYETAGVKAFESLFQV